MDFSSCQSRNDVDCRTNNINDVMLSISSSPVSHDTAIVTRFNDWRLPPLSKSIKKTQGQKLFKFVEGKEEFFHDNFFYISAIFFHSCNFSEIFPSNYCEGNDEARGNREKKYGGNEKNKN